MHPDLAHLIQLQEIDYDIGELERSKEYIPDMISALRAEIDQVTKALLDSKEDLAKTAMTQKQTELEVVSLQDDLKRYQSQMMSIKTNKEYDALVHEIATIKKAIADFESTIIVAMEKSEGVTRSLGALETKAQEALDTNTKQIGSLQTRMDSVGGKIADRQREREQLVTLIGRQSLAVYERVRRGKGAAVIVAIKKGACGACFKAIPPQRLQELKRNDRILCCDSCGRMLAPEA